MKVTLESTDRIVDVNGQKARIWEGTTESGVRVYAAVAVIAVHQQSDNSEFERELQERSPATIQASQAFPLSSFFD